MCLRDLVLPYVRIYRMRGRCFNQQVHEKLSGLHITCVFYHVSICHISCSLHSGAVEVRRAFNSILLPLAAMCKTPTRISLSGKYGSIPNQSAIVAFIPIHASEDELRSLVRVPCESDQRQTKTQSIGNAELSRPTKRTTVKECDGLGRY